MFSFGKTRPARRPNLTPMIDVVFLLLVFFMLASRFAQDRVIPLTAGTAGQGQATWQGPMRLVEIGPEGALALNGAAILPADLAPRLKQLVESPADPVILRGRGASLQDLTMVMDGLRAAGFTRLLLVE